MYTLISRFYFSFLACGWAAFVFCLHQTIGYEKVPNIKSIGWGCLFSSPIVLGAICPASTSIPARIIRLIAATLLLAQLFIMLLVVWLGEIRIIIYHIAKGSFWDPFFICFVLAPPMLISVAAGLLLTPEVKAFYCRMKRLQRTAATTAEANSNSQSRGEVAVR